MRINSRIVLVIALTGGAFPALALDDVKTPAGDPAALHMFKDPRQAMSTFVEGYRDGKPASSQDVDALRYAADNGDPLARWKLGTMYASGDDVTQDDYRAYQYFTKIIAAYDDAEPSPRERAIVARAFVAVGAYALHGIDGDRLRPDPARAMRMFSVAATEFRDPAAQYNLGRMYLNGDGSPRDARLAAQWLRLAAEKNHMGAQALLGQLYFDGAEGFARQRAMGLMYLTMAREAAGDRRANQWIVDAYNHAMTSANSSDRQAALVVLKDRLDRGR